MNVLLKSRVRSAVSRAARFSTAPADLSPHLRTVRNMEFKHLEKIPVRWGDQDCFGHVNNCAFVQYMETSRVKLVEDAWKLCGHTGMPGPGAVSVIVGDISIKYVGPANYPDTISCHSNVSNVEETSLFVNTKAVTEAGNTCFVSSCKVVFFNYDTNKRIPIPDDLRAAFLSFAESS